MEDGAKTDDTANIKCLILVLCGLPASGKTYLSRILREKLSHNDRDDCLSPKLPPCNVNHICYDELMPPDLEKQLIQDGQSDTDESIGTSWKSFRRSILACTEDAVAKFIDLADSRIPLDVPEELTKRYDAMLQNGSASRERDVEIFIIDDNMYYAGMRYEYYKLAKKYNISFAEVYVTCSVTEVQLRNATRHTPVPENVIATMAERYEPPDLSSLWEKYSLTVNGEGELHSQLDLIVKLISSALNDPVRDLLAELERQQQESRSETLASTVHQVDQVLRRVVADVMKDVKDNGMSGNDIKTLAGKLRAIKPEILQQFRCGTLNLTEDELSEGFQSNSKRSLFHRLKLFVQEKF